MKKNDLSLHGMLAVMLKKLVSLSSPRLLFWLNFVLKKFPRLRFLILSCIKKPTLNDLQKLTVSEKKLFNSVKFGINKK